MTHNRLILGILVLGLLAPVLPVYGQQPPVGPPAPNRIDGEVSPDADRLPDTTLQRFRMPMNVLAERAIGQTSRRVRFDWRRGMFQVGAVGGLPAELNNFDSLSAGGFVRKPYGNLMLELALSKVWVNGSDSTRALALTPYRQPGRPPRLELDFAAAYAIAEGVVTPYPGLLPAVQLVLNAQAQLRYHIYPGSMAGLGWKDTLQSIVAGSLSNSELANLQQDRLPGMEIDRGRYRLLMGLGNDFYFLSGVFFGYRLLVATPLMSIMSDTKLHWGYEFDLTAGVAF